MELSIRTVAMIVLMTMFIALVFVAFQGWFNDILQGFMNPVMSYMNGITVTG